MGLLLFVVRRARKPLLGLVVIIVIACAGLAALSAVIARMGGAHELDFPDWLYPVQMFGQFLLDNVFTSRTYIR
jgi:hypothetical protein